MTSLPMSIFLNIPELITYLQPLSCQIWGFTWTNFIAPSLICSIYIPDPSLSLSGFIGMSGNSFFRCPENTQFYIKIRNTFTFVLWQIIAPSERHQTSSLRLPPFEASACHQHPFHFAAFLHTLRENSLTIRSETAYISAKLHKPNQIYVYKILTVRTTKSNISTLDSMARSISITRIATNTLLSSLTGNNS